jgi:hypothetical protein
MKSWNRWFDFVLVEKLLDSFKDRAWRLSDIIEECFYLTSTNNQERLLYLIKKNTGSILSVDYELLDVYKTSGCSEEMQMVLFDGFAHVKSTLRWCKKRNQRKKKSQNNQNENDCIDTALVKIRGKLYQRNQMTPLIDAMLTDVMKVYNEKVAVARSIEHPVFLDIVCQMMKRGFYTNKMESVQCLRSPVMTDFNLEYEFYKAVRSFVFGTTEIDVWSQNIITLGAKVLMTCNDKELLKELCAPDYMKWVSIEDVTNPHANRYGYFAVGVALVDALANRYY